MRVAVVYNRESRKVINLFGTPNQEKIGLKTIKRSTDALKAGGHTVTAIEGDKDLIDRLAEFMPSVVKGERPGMVFNVSYGIQGQARYTHVPSILEMVGIPYVASGPLAHSLALEKVVSKMISRQHGIPTADFAVLDTPETPVPELTYPMIVKPKNEAVSFGLKVVHDPDELREAAQVIFDRYQQAVLVEQYIDGREVNVGLLGNAPVEALPPALLEFGDGPQVYTYEDKTRKSGREIQLTCPAPLGPELTERVQSIAKDAFRVLGCYDCARVDFRLDADDNPYVLEVNSLPSMGEHGSYVEGAAHVGLDFAGLVNRLVEVASARYFGTPLPARVSRKGQDPADLVFQFLTERRDRIERRVKDWVGVSSRTHDMVGMREAARILDKRYGELGLRPLKDCTDGRYSWAWETAGGLDGGTLLVSHLDVPLSEDAAHQAYRRDPDYIHGEGVASSRAPLAMVEYALRALRHQKRLRTRPIGIFHYADEGADAQDSAERLRQAAARARRVLVLRPGTADGRIITRRRGLRRYRLVIEGPPRRLGAPAKKPEVLRWAWQKLEAIAGISDRKARLALSATDVRTVSYPMNLPHRVTASVVLGYPDADTADAAVRKVRALLGKEGYRWEFECVADRPPQEDRKANTTLAKSLQAVADRWELPLGTDSSVWPSVAGLVPGPTGVLCGLGPVSQALHTPREAVSRMSLLQRTLLLTQFLRSVEE